MSKWKLYVVPHTHWDKEWYFTKQDSDVLLINNFEKIIEQLTSDKAMTFTLDGQVSIVDDYLTYCPEKTAIIKTLIESGQLVIGPWYTQPDFYNTSSETIFRNLLFGINYSRSLSKNYLNVAYVPDSFGHNDQMPQIYKLFGLKGFIYWRGISQKTINKTGIINNWKGIDGSEILSYNLLYGYWSFGANYPYEQQDDISIDVQVKEFLKKVSPLVERIKKFTKGLTNKILIPFGGDQAPIIKDLAKFMKEVNKQSKDEWVISTYEIFIDELSLDAQNVQVMTDELKNPYLSRIHRTIGSQRIDIKQLLKNVEIKFYQILEPLLTNFYWVSKKNFKEIEKQITKKILVSVAHDSIGGCNSDRTNANIKNRLWEAQDLINSLETQVLKTIANNLNLQNEEFIIYNPHLCSTNISQKITLYSKYVNFDLVTADNREINFEIIETKHHDSGLFVTSGIEGEDFIKGVGYYEHEIIIKSLQVKSQEIIKINLIKKKLNKVKLINDFLQINNDTIVYNKKFVIKLIADNDYGDSYDFSPSSYDTYSINDLVHISKKSTKNNYEQKYTITYLLRTNGQSFKKIRQQFNVSFFEINKNKLIVRVTTINQATEVRWRIQITDLQSKESVWSDQCYSVTMKKNNQELEKWKVNGWKEAPVNIHSFESALIRKNGFNIYTNSFNEFENTWKNIINLTLYRSISYLGRNDLLNRPGRASGTSETCLPTSDTQFLQQKLSWEFCLESNSENELFSAQNFITPIAYYQVQNYNSIFKNADRFLLIPEKISLTNWTNITIKNKNFIIKSITKAKKSEAIIVRGFNATTNDLCLQFFENDSIVKFEICNVFEETTSKLLDQVLINPNEIVTLLIRRSKDDY